MTDEEMVARLDAAIGATAAWHSIFRLACARAGSDLRSAVRWAARRSNAAAHRCNPASSIRSGQFACRENALALTKLQEAQHWLHHRTLARMARGVEGTHHQ